ncbi:MAG TPA: heme biosynthesis HemY N-terminal domain-containing protein [Woeseiaceae bacterium]|jgi:HemY protein|nr:heme biosynthesis HemY N-terminal domain-containing protein [Woeseiaceae bacterium]
MKFGFIVVAVLVLTALAAQALMQDPGYVVINFGKYVVEMSVPVLLLFLMLLGFTAWMLVRIVRAPRRLGEAAGRLRSGRAGNRLTRGMIEVAEGNFARGERMLSRAAPGSDAPLLNYLQAARAAHLQGADERRDRWLREAYERTPEAASAVLLTQAELQLDQDQYEQALATLRRLEEKAPNHSQALNLLGTLYYRLEDWNHLGELLPRLRQHGRLEDTVLERWSVRVYREKIERAADAESLAAAWNAVPRALKDHLELLEARCSALMRTGQNDRAEKEIAQQLKRKWRAPLVRVYGLIESSDPGRQLRRAEAWLKEHADDLDLLLASARLCLRNELWGKARSYLETVVAIRPTPEAYQEYGRLLSQLGEGDAAAEAWRAGLLLAAKPEMPAIPHLAPESAPDL